MECGFDLDLDARTRTHNFVPRSSFPPVPLLRLRGLEEEERSWERVLIGGAMEQQGNEPHCGGSRCQTSEMERNRARRDNSIPPRTLSGEKYERTL